MCRGRKGACSVAATRLDPGLLDKLAAKTGKDVQYVREQISRRAGRLSIASEAAQVLWAKEFGIGTAAYQRRLDPHVQQQITNVGNPTSRQVLSRTNRERVERGPRAISPIRAAIDFLLSDDELKRRCSDLLTARRNFDRVFREATVVLDQRLKRLANIKGRMNPQELVARTLHPDKAILVVSEHRDEQQGFFELIKGLMAVFRNPTHHSLNDKLTREEALQFCGFIDSLLSILGRAQVSADSQPE
jgi:hypothetical protein